MIHSRMRGIHAILFPMPHSSLTRICLLALSVNLVCTPYAALAQTVDEASPDSTTTAAQLPPPTFNPNHILDDRDLFDWQTMNRNDIQQFLLTHGTLGTYHAIDSDGTSKLAADIIWRVVNSYKISARYLLALIQKEQSLVSDAHPTQKQFDWAAGYAVCDSCSMNDPSLQMFKGFASQIEWAAKQHREKYLLQILGHGTTLSGYAPGKPITIDHRLVIPDNEATAMLYTYTPHLHGNFNLWNIWQRWFSLSFPEGTVVRGATSNVAYQISNGQRLPFKNDAVLASIVNPDRVVKVEDSQLANYTVGPEISFPNYSVIQAPDEKRYLIVGDTKRLIQNRSVFKRIGFSEDEVVPAANAELAGYTDGSPITLKSLYPLGILAKDAQGQPWYIENGIKHPIPSPILVKLYFTGIPYRHLSSSAMRKLTLGTPYQFKDGELIRAKGDPSVYVIENGMRRPIISREAFNEMGWKISNVIAIPLKLLESYPVGALVDPHAADTTLTSDQSPTSTSALAVNS